MMHDLEEGRSSAALRESVAGEADGILSDVAREGAMAERKSRSAAPGATAIRRSMRLLPGHVVEEVQQSLLAAGDSVARWARVRHVKSPLGSSFPRNLPFIKRRVADAQPAARVARHRLARGKKPFRRECKGDSWRGYKFARAALVRRIYPLWQQCRSALSALARRSRRRHHITKSHRDRAIQGFHAAAPPSRDRRDGADTAARWECPL